MTITIQAEKRETFGKNANRRLRKQGLVPAILYGESMASVPLVLEKKDIVQILKSETRENTLFQVGFGDEVRDAMIKELQIDPVSDELIHADLVQIAMDKLIKVTVPIVPKGEAVGVKTEGGFVDFVTREIEVDCLPKDIPERIEIDITDLHLHQSVKVENVTPPEGVRFVSEPGTVLVLISLPHKEEEEFPGEKPEEAAAEDARSPRSSRRNGRPKSPRPARQGKGQGEGEVTGVGRRRPGQSRQGVRRHPSQRGLRARQAPGPRVGRRAPGEGYRARTAETEREGGRVLLVVPQTFMNLSGLSVRELLKGRRVEPENVVIVYDDLDIPLGRHPRPEAGHGGDPQRPADRSSGKRGARVSPGSGSGSAPCPTAATPRISSLSPFSRAEKTDLAGALDEARDALLMILDGDIDRAMNSFNAK